MNAENRTPGNNQQQLEVTEAGQPSDEPTNASREFLLQPRPQQPSALSEQAIAELIRINLAATRTAIQREEHERALRSLQLVIRLKHELWERFLPEVRVMARRFAPYTNRGAGLIEDDLVSEAFLKYTRISHRWESGKGSTIGA